MTSDSTGPAGGPHRRLRVGQVPGVTLTKWRRTWAERFPRIPLDVVDVDESGQRTALDTGSVDMCFVRLPINADGLHAIPLYDEAPVVVAPKDHPLAAVDDVSLAELAAETLVASDLADAFDRVAWGAGVLRVPQSIARSHSRRDLIYRPVTDAEPTTIALAWLRDNPHELIEEFIGVVRGRTVNSSRTAADRAGRKTPPTAPPKTPPKASPKARRQGRRG